MAERYLTQSEINEILSDVPLPQAAEDEVAQQALIEIKHSYYLLLQRKKVRSDGLKLLKAWVNNLCRRGFIQPGDHIGMTVGEANGQPATQMTLKGFHYAGQAGKATGVERYRLRLNLSKKQAVTITIVHFKDKYLSFDQTFALANRFISHTVTSLLLRKGNGSDPGYKFLSTMNPDGSVVPLVERAAWYRFAEPSRFNGFDPEYRGPYLRLTFHPMLLYVHKISLTTIADRLQRDDKGSSLVCIPSPASVGQIDIYPISGSIGSRFLGSFKASDKKENIIVDSLEMQASIFFQENVIPSFDDIKIGGIDGVTSVSVDRISVMEIVRDIEEDFDQVSGQPIPNQWRVWIDQVTLKHRGIPMLKLLALLRHVGFQILDETRIARVSGNPDSGYIRVGYTIPADVKSTPKEIIGDAIRVGDTEFLTNAKKPGLVKDLVVPEILTHAHYYVANVVGPNYRKLVNHRLVDSRHTICDNPHEIYKVRGIEAVRGWLEREFYEIFFSAGQSIAPRNISAIPDMMTNSGGLIPITSRGTARQQRGAFADATFEDAVGAFRDAASAGRKQNIINTSAAITVGQRISSGTGAFKLRRNERVIAEYRRLQREYASNNKKNNLDIPSFQRASMDVPAYLYTILRLTEDDLENMLGDLTSLPEEPPAMIVNEYAAWLNPATHYFNIPDGDYLEDLF